MVVKPPPVELSRPTILNLVAILCYCLAILFHIISFATDNWSSITVQGVRYTVGLWQGCRKNETTDEWHCSTDVFNDEVFKTGSDWLIGTRILMVFSLILLLFLEFAIIAYACIKRLERYKSRLVAIILGLSATSAFCHFLILIMFGTEVEKIPDSSVQGSYGIIVISLLMELAVIVLTQLDKRRRFPSENVFIETGVKNRKRPQEGSAQPRRGEKNRAFTVDNDFISKSKMPVVSLRTSVSSLSEAETYRKFAYMEDPTGSIGSANSLVTQGTMVTTVPSTFNDTSSIESRV